ncbi:protein fork head-like [Huso huso]|uniref:Protein fork head-like n=1 Tax=Huso huso TaxID=61971 RepID=A0ABR0YTX5_HUSHU
MGEDSDNHIKCIIPRSSTPFPEQRMHKLPFHSPTRDINSPLATSHPHPHHHHHNCTSPVHYIPGRTSITALPVHGVTHHRHHDCTSPLHYIPGRTSITALPVHSPPPCSTTHPNAAHHRCISSLHSILRHASDTTLPVQTLSVNWQRDSDAALDMVFDLRAQSTLSVFSQLGRELEYLCAVGTRVCNVSRQLPTAKQGEKELQ